MGYSSGHLINMAIQRAECWWGAGERSGEGAAPSPQQKRNCAIYILHSGNLLYIYYTPRIYYTTHQVVFYKRSDYGLFVRSSDKYGYPACRMLVGCGGEVWGEGSAPALAKKKLCYIYYTAVICYIYIYYTAYHVSHVNAHP